ncbi:MAG: hypothetical protein JWQ78_353 [Sediminibacterium sp.]|nr:hypothetical protein [Sediminibacterium sp.]
MAYENNDKKMESVYSKRIRAGKRRTYFFDVRATRGNDYFLTITESRKRFDDNGYDRHKIFLYKEDFNKFIKALGEAIDYVKTDLMPDFDFDAFNHEYNDAETEGAATTENTSTENAEVTETEERPAIAASAVSEPIAAAMDEEIAPVSVAPTHNSDAAAASSHDSEVVDKW